MATSSIWFYRVGWNVSENAYVDDLENYLDNLPDTYNRSDFQYIRHGINISIKVDVSQTLVNNFNFNYCKIYNSSDEHEVYYYIKNVKQVAQQTLEIELIMDTINSLIDPRNFTDKTEIEREHEDRFDSNYYTDEWGIWAARKIDKQSEGIVPEKIKTTDTTLIGNERNLNWYLIYRSKNNIDPENPDAPNPIQTLMCADLPIKYATQEYTPGPLTLTINDFDDGQYYYFLVNDNPLGKFTVDGQPVNFVSGSSVNKPTEWTTQYNVPVVTQITNCRHRGLVVHRSGSTLEYTMIYDKIHLLGDKSFTLYSRIGGVSSGAALSYAGGKWTTCSTVEFEQADYWRVSDTDYTLQNLQPEGIAAKINNRTSIFVGDTEEIIINTIFEVDRTDSRLLKIIKYPYCPIENSYNPQTETWSFNERWIYDNATGLIVYESESIPQMINSEFANVSLFDSKIYIGTPSKTADHMISAESKLYHSDFTQNKFVYDSFSTEVKLEDVHTTTNNTTPAYVTIDFKPTSTINSKMGFKFRFRNSSYDESQDFDRLLLVTRNNEETILNNEYINYIKYGYEYDKKQNALQIENAQRSATMSTIGSGLGIAASVLGIALGGPAVKATSAIGLGTSIVSGVATTTNAWQNINATEEKQTTAMAAKLAQLAAQSTSTSGTDDVDLMSWYSDNKLHYMKYTISDLTKNKLYNLFRLTGYSHNTIDKPDVDSRIWYNYIKCTPNIIINNAGKFKEEWVNDLKQRYQQGVTVYHPNEINGNTVYDFDREYENWEVWFFNE